MLEALFDLQAFNNHQLSNIAFVDIDYANIIINIQDTYGGISRASIENIAIENAGIDYCIVCTQGLLQLNVTNVFAQNLLFKI